MMSVQEKLSKSIHSLNLDQPISVSGRVNRYDGQMVEFDGFPANNRSLAEQKPMYLKKRNYWISWGTKSIILMILVLE